MRYLIIMLAIAVTASMSTCQEEPAGYDSEGDVAVPPGPGRSEGDVLVPPWQGRSVLLSVTLTEATQRPSPVGLPTKFTIGAAQLPKPGSTVEVTWQAVDGAPDRPPREGTGQLVLGSNGIAVAITLTANGNSEEETLTLKGTLDEMEIRGSFSDRLFFPRAGAFRAEIGET